MVNGELQIGTADRLYEVLEMLAECEDVFAVVPSVLKSVGLDREFADLREAFHNFSARLDAVHAEVADGEL